jgi:hypothetical protein
MTQDPEIPLVRVEYAYVHQNMCYSVFVAMVLIAPNWKLPNAHQRYDEQVEYINALT